MKYGMTVLGLVLAITFFSYGSASAVGYEKRYTTPSPNAASAKARSYHRSLVDKLEEASLVEKCPALIEGFAEAVRDILSQFGITDKRAP